MASPMHSPSFRSFSRMDMSFNEKENAVESPYRKNGAKRGRIPTPRSSPTPGALESFDTLDSPAKEEISRTFGTHYAKILGKRAPLSPVSTNSPKMRRLKSKATPSTPGSPILSKRVKVDSPMMISPRPVTPRPAASIAKLAAETMPVLELAVEEELVVEEDVPEITPMDFSISQIEKQQQQNEEQEEYDEYGFLCESKRGKPKAVPLDPEMGESLLRDGVESITPVNTAVNETAAWWQKWLSEGVARHSESGFSAPFNPLLQGPTSPQQRAAAHNDHWRPVATGMVMQYGVPHQLRRQVWPALAKVESLQRKILSSCVLSEDPGSYYKNLLRPNNFEHHTWSRIIRLDLDRTFATHKLFRERGGAGQLHLSNVLTAYAHHNPAIGYCQGMSFVAATLLMITECDEVEAFWLLCAIMDAPEYSMSTYYSPGMQGLLSDSAQLAPLIKMALPQVHHHLFSKCGIDVVYFTARWWLSMFTDLGSWSTTLRMWDLFFAEGRSALQRISIALLSLCKHDLMGQDNLDGVLPYILNIPAARLESSLLFQIVDEIDVAQLQLKYQYWLKEEQNKSKKKEQLEKIRKEKVAKVAAAPSTPGARSLFARIWEKISTPSQSDAPESYKYTALATGSPHESPKRAPIQMQASVATTGRAKRKRADAHLFDDNDEEENDNIMALDLSDAARASAFVNLNALSGRKLTFDQLEDKSTSAQLMSPAKRAKLTESAPISRKAHAAGGAGESHVTVHSSERDSFLQFATPTKRRNW